MKNNFRTSDLNNLIIKDKHGRKILNRFFYSRVFVTFLLIAIQIAIFVIFLVKLNSHSEYYFGSSIGLSALFMIYLSNSKGKNEFKIAWLVPIVIFPLFGVAAYIMYHTNMGGLIYKKRFLQLGKTIQSYKNDGKSDLRKLKKYEEVQDLGNYLLTYGKFTPYEKTKVTYYNSGENFLPELLEQLKKAENFIFIEYFIINVDECWTSILEVLKEKAKKGVTVRVMYDGLGSVTASQSSYQKFLKENGIDSHIFLPLVPFFSTQLNNRDHRKIVVIDGKTAFTGGINLSNEYFNFGKNKFSYWKDNAVKVEGAAVKGFTEMFLQTWNLQTKQEDEYEKYAKGCYEVSFDATGGTIDTLTKTVYYGSKYGELPEPIKNFYRFDGWYTDATEGTRITEDLIFDFSKNITLYAHWQINPTSDWVLESELPENAKIESTKWTYDLVTRKSSSSKTMDGYTQYDSTWVWGSYGNWSEWQNSAVSGSDYFLIRRS